MPLGRILLFLAIAATLNCARIAAPTCIVVSVVARLATGLAISFGRLICFGRLIYFGRLICANLAGRLICAVAVVANFDGLGTVRGTGRVGGG